MIRSPFTLWFWTLLLHTRAIKGTLAENSDFDELDERLPSKVLQQPSTRGASQVPMDFFKPRSPSEPSTVLAATHQNTCLGPESYEAPAKFPASYFKKYYHEPLDPMTQPQPIITDPITHVVYRMNLTSPDEVPTINLRDPISLPPISLRGADARQLADNISFQIISIINSSNSTQACQSCLTALETASRLARQAPQLIPALAVSLCKTFKFKKDCEIQYGLHSQGPIIAQLLAYADTAAYDGQYICYNFFPKSGCLQPPVVHLNLTRYFSKPKPSLVHQSSPQQSTKVKRRLKVLHFSDFHLDPRYATGSEANCTTSGMCCRMPVKVTNNSSATMSCSVPAPHFGYFKCDTPISLGMAAVQAIPVLTGTNVSDGNGFDWTIYTGDLVAHDNTNQLSREYVEYVETLLYDVWKERLGGGPLYAAIGNHDSYLQAQDAPHSLMPERLSKQFSWNYDHLSRLWTHNHWVSDDVAKIARAHYGGYAVNRYEGLKVITLNTDLWYRVNLFNYINMTDPDPSEMLAFLAEELQKSEDRGQSVWIMGHVLSGWDGTNPLANPTNLFYQLVERFSPHVIKAILWGHTHEDQFQIFYANNATSMTAEHALATAWVGPSITPLTNVNSGFRMYEVDPDTFEILDAHTWYSDVSSYQSLDSEPRKGPTYQYEYSTREAYGKNISWPANAPLNATWWHLVTEQMLEDGGTLIKQFTHFQGKSSVRSPNCTNEDCIKNKVCYMRSGSVPIAREHCKTGYGSVQGS
ncbi:hypothetical protein CROQUDRAFT_658631 [Cronartium quercuum f. sp. fusiforme G11]|uniref:Calcineurin-like phosphoesterase domain-containing protein n=1 Tax=Cronartium quercuum f. sp. fusiforme G11 TaxID=708437 RepID=A0A9P6NGB5_9BASI|nr:hypothetical protein CROQUDRAFT_658631 [Cronartium quercuum f. sp. fusiforme G11]